MNNTKSNVPKLRFPEFTDDWEQRKLGDMMNVTSVKRIHQSDWTDSGIRFLRARDIVAAAKGEEPSDLLYISKEKYEEYSALSGKVAVDDLLVTGVGTIGIPYLISNSEPLYFKDGNIIWFQNCGKINGKFFYYSFTGEQIQSFIKDSAGIGTVGTYTIESGKKTPILLPGIEEQRKIGTFFTDLDNLITLHQRKLEQIKEYKKGMLQKMFPKDGKKVPEIRFPGFTDDWEQRKLSDEFVNFIVPMRDKPKEFGGNIPWTRIEDIEGKYLNDSLSGQYVTEETVKQMNLKIIPKDSLIVSSSATFGVVAVITQDLITNQTFIGLVPNNKDTLDYWYSFFHSDEARKYMRLESAGSTIFYIARESFENMPIKVPSKDEMIKIGSYFNIIDHLITLHQRKLDDMKECKKGLLQQMFV